ncbi:MAG TPA: YciI family protein [Bacteroidales bacterium]|nr:YciI family protein [Bacteroidales bacterium]
MQFLVIGYDGEDAGALERRMKSREKHLERIEQLKKSGNFIFGGAMLDDNGKMIGSTIVYEFPDRKDLDKILKDEPYIVGDVWKKVTIYPYRLAK